MAEFRISVDMSGAMRVATRVIDATVLPRLNQAARAVVQQTQANWMEAVGRSSLRDAEKVAYASSIASEMTGDFEGRVWTDYRYAEEIENGRPPRDLKRMLDTSLKVRTSKKGKRYLIIPFRHNTPGQNGIGQPMPASIYAAAKALSASSVTGMGTRPSGTGAFDAGTRQALTVPQRTYSWGEKLVGAATMGGNKNHEGMYRFTTTTPGGRRSSSYLTFRTMVEGSPGWITKPTPGLNIVRKVIADMQPKAEAAFRMAMKVA